MSRATSIAGVRPLGWLARARARPERRSWRGRAQSSCLADGAGAAGLGPITALGNGARDGHARQRSGGQAKHMQTFRSDTNNRVEPRRTRAALCLSPESGACKGIRLHILGLAPRALTRMPIARPVAQRRDWPQPRSARAVRQAASLGTPRNCAVGAHARGPTQWPHACDRRRATHRALPACPPAYADYILRLQDTKPESLEIMLRLLIVALPLVVGGSPRLIIWSIWEFL